MLNYVFANRLRSALSGSALALLLAALTPALATAAPKDADEPPDFSVSMEVRGTHGYTIGIGADDHRTVSITTFKGEGSATYSVRGRATSDRIEANFGKFGRVSVRFTPAGKRKGRNCGIIPGYFDGVIRFRGELGYTEVRAKRTRGEVNPPGGGRRCDARAAARPGVDSRSGVRDLLAKASEPDLGITALGAVARMGGRTISFNDVELTEIHANGAVEPVLVISVGAIEERRGRISISRLVLLVPNRPVTVPSPPGQQPLTAIVKAAKPFQGTGSYLAVPGAEPSWTGDFSVSLPGAGLVPLTGPEFDALLCTGALTKANEACLDDLEGLVDSPAGKSESLSSLGAQAAASSFLK
ncbi:MAG TPA: hypothetical protein VMS60_11175 [Solirubrobacterales bacterium]|nr:hypothetical protein [Solirubrobacterales bacterium]